MIKIDLVRCKKNKMFKRILKRLAGKINPLNICNLMY